MTRGAAGDCVEPRNEFVDVKGFGEVIVGAEVEAFESLIECATGCDEHYRRGDAALANIAQNAETVASRNHDIEYECVVRAGGGERERFITMRAEIDVEAPGFEPFEHEARELRVVFEHQEFHFSR